MMMPLATLDRLPRWFSLLFFPDLAPKFISSSSTTILNSMALKTNLDEIYVY